MGRPRRFPLSLKTEPRWAEYREKIEAWLAACVPAGTPERLAEAMRYSLLAGGKRLRPMLALEFCRLCGGDWEAALPAACAVELLHTYSLIHDDLPAMDNDVLRRGKPTCHIAFDEPTAILAGDALQALAFEAIADAPLPAERVVNCLRDLALAAGAAGMCGGQQLDLDGDGKPQTVASLTQLQSLKTGALIRAACCIGVHAAGGSPEQLAAAEAYAEALGLAFQIRDDMLDEIADEAAFGKPIGSDKEQGKCTFLTVLGLEACAERVHELTDAAVSALRSLPGSEALCELASELAERMS